MHCGNLMLARTGTYKYSGGGGGKLTDFYKLNAKCQSLGSFLLKFTFFAERSKHFKLDIRKLNSFVCLEVN